MTEELLLNMAHMVIDRAILPVLGPGITNATPATSDPDQDGDDDSRPENNPDLQDDMSLDRAVGLINSNQAQNPLSPEDIYVFRMQLSNQNIDSYGTRMGLSSLQNYAADFTQGRSLMNSHRGGGGFLSQSELPVGRTFAARVVGNPLPEDADSTAQGGAALQVYSYIQRGLQLTDIPTDSVIKGIEGGTVRDGSIGFQMAQGAQYRCGICGRDMLRDPECVHVPMADYGKAGRGFAWVEGARAVEASLVYAHSTPGAVIEKAIRMVETGQLTRMDAMALEDVYETRIISGKPLTVPKDTKVQSADITVIPAVDQRAETEHKVVDMDYKLLVDQLVGLPLAERLQAAKEPDQITTLAKEIRDLATANTNLQAQAALGVAWLKDLVDQAVKERVRAVGQGKFNEDKYRAFLTNSGDPEFIKGEILNYGDVARAALGKDRPTREAGLDLVEHVDPPVGQKAKRKVPSKVYGG